MLSFECDYNEGCLPELLDALARTNNVAQPGYGSDEYSLSAAEKIRAVANAPEAEVYFISGGTQTNQLVIDTLLAPYEGVVAAETGHVAVHEAGAIEYGGHKVLTVPSHMGKVEASEVRDLVRRHYADGNHEHMVFPGMLYVSQPTEYGTLYTAEELCELASVCQEASMRLYVDGARLGYALASDQNDVDLPLIAELADAFYIGGTKMGALLGEALVFPRHAPAHFLTRIKQHGALMAKGRVIGVQFDELFTNDLYLRAGRHAIEQAARLRAVLHEVGAEFYLESPTNQQFIIVDNDVLEGLAQEVNYGYWEPFGEDRTVIRFATSWATRPEDVDALAGVLARRLPAGE